MDFFVVALFLKCFQGRNHRMTSRFYLYRTKGALHPHWSEPSLGPSLTTLRM